MNKHTDQALTMLEDVDTAIAIRTGNITWKVVWIKYYLRLNLSSQRYYYLGYLSIHQMLALNVPES